MTQASHKSLQPAGISSRPSTPEIVLRCPDGVEIVADPAFLSVCSPSSRLCKYISTHTPQKIALSTEESPLVVQKAMAWLQEHIPAEPRKWAIDLWRALDFDDPEPTLLLPCSFEQLLSVLNFALRFALEPLVPVLTYQLWHDAPDFASLCRVSKLFLQGSIPISPSHLGPLDEETLPYVPILVRLADLGILTIHSQPYEKGPEIYNKWVISSLRPEERGREWFYEQRPFLGFLMTTRDDRYKKVCERLMDHPELATIAYTGNPDRRYPSADQKTNDESLRDYNSLEIHRTVDKFGRLRSNNAVTPPDYECRPSDEAIYDHQFIRDTDPVMIDIKTRDWEADIFTILEDVVTEALA